MIHLIYLSLAIILHEAGHFISAKLVGMKVQKFCLFIDWGVDLFNITYKGTKYSLGWLPLGGYIRIQDLFIYTLVTKKRKNKYLVLLSGGIVNILLGVSFFFICREFALINFLIGFFNLLPLYKNDGYYIFKMLIDKKKNPWKDGYFEDYYYKVLKGIKNDKVTYEIVFAYYKDGFSVKDAIKRIKTDFEVFI